MKLKALTTVRTNNFNDPAIVDKIKSLWEQNLSIVENTFNNKQSIFIVYHDYASDYHGDYAVSLCINSQVEADFDTSNYNWIEYSVNSESNSGVIATWQKVWNDEDKNIIKRAYGFDYEKHEANGNISIKISIIN